MLVRRIQRQDLLCAYRPYAGYKVLDVLRIPQSRELLENAGAFLERILVWIRRFLHKDGKLFHEFLLGDGMRGRGLRLLALVVRRCSTLLDFLHGLFKVLVSSRAQVLQNHTVQIRYTVRRGLAGRCTSDAGGSSIRSGRCRRCSRHNRRSYNRD